MSRLDDINHFIGASRRIASAAELRALVETITLEMGFQTYSLFQHVTHSSWTEPRNLVLSNFSRGWINYFLRYGCDPVLRASHRTAVGFTFDDIPSLIQLTPYQRKIM